MELGGGAGLLWNVLQIVFVENNEMYMSMLWIIDRDFLEPISVSITDVFICFKKTMFF